MLVATRGYEINWTAAGVPALMDDAMIAFVYDAKPLQEVLEQYLEKNV